jgi:two-component system response regulator NreC
MTILIVDDHVHIRKLLKEWLKDEFPHCGFLEAACAKDAINYCCRDESPDLVIMDISLPEINGITATLEIKTLQPEVPVVILTIYENDVYREAALKAGANGYVVKDRIHEDLIPLIAGLLPQESGATL